MKKFTPHIILFSLLILSIIPCIILFNKATVGFKTTHNAQHIENDFQRIEKQLVSVISDKDVINKLVTDVYTFDEFKKISDYPFGVIVYDGDSAILWTNNSIIPVNAQLTENDKPLLITESNGSYVLFKHEFENSKIRTVGFLPLRFEYGINNQYLNNVKTKGIYIPQQFSLSVRQDASSVPVHDMDGSVVFYISNNVAKTSPPVFNGWLIITLWLSFILLLIISFLVSEYIVKRFNKTAGIACMFLCMLILYSLATILQYPLLQYIPIFDPSYYASPLLANSEGDLLIKTVLFFCFSLFFVRYFHVNKSSRYLLIINILCIVVFCFLSAGLITIFKSLILDSNISFDIHNFFSLNYFSFIGFLCVAAGMMGYIWISYRLLDSVSRSHTPQKIILIICTGITLLILFNLFIVRKTDKDVLFFIAGVLLIYAFMRYRKIYYRTFQSILLWLIFISAFSAYIFNESLHIKSEENERLFAEKKSVEKDAVAEYNFNQEQNDIIRRLALQVAVSDTGKLIKPGLVNQLRQELQNNYFKKYVNDIFIFLNDSLIASSQENKPRQSSLIDAIENNGEFTTTRNLYFINDNTGNYYYLAQLPVKTDSLQKVTAYIRFVPRKFSSRSIYPELLIDKDIKTPDVFSRFDYAIYNSQNLTERKGDYSYPIMDVFFVDKSQEFAEQVSNGYEHLIYRVNDTKKVVISEKKESFIEPFSYFSYLFFFFLLFLTILVAIDFIVRLLKGKIKWREWLNTTLQNKIQASVISLIVFAFIIMGIATVIYIINQYNNSHKERLLNKIESVQTNINYIFNEAKKKAADKSYNPVQIKRITNRISELSDIHDMDINIYTPGGDLLTSSQPDIFNRGLVSTKMNPLAYFKMNCDKETWYIQTEYIGRLKYLSAYVPIMNSEGDVLFYLNLPYFATEQNLRSEISNFMVTLINVYVLLLVMAAFIAFIVSRNITRPLAVIAGTFKNIKLGKKNEPVKWNHEDEIGLLVNEYNNMLKELEKSAALLAKSERESAWRDMAKQVAHEIKNPLTPMRLSIQHLQRALQTNSPDVNELTEKVTKTLLEQIDNLNFIASEFSNFAVMPKTVNEYLNLNEVLENVTSLFKENEEAELHLDLPAEHVKIFADKNQLIRVFNNLIKNAIQAIPGERKGIINISLLSFDHRALVKVEDNGIGIPDEQKDKVFVPNFTTKSSGMGIGLAMSKNIIESNGGYIWFESALNEGTTFFIEFEKN